MKSDRNCEGGPVEDDLGVSHDSSDGLDCFSVSHVLGQPVLVVDDGKLEAKWKKKKCFITRKVVRSTIVSSTIILS